VTSELFLRVVDDLERCLPGRQESVTWAALLIERSRGCDTGLSEFDAIVVTAEQAERLKQALLFALQCHPDVVTRGAIAHALGKLRDPLLKKVFVRELLAMSRLILEASSSLFQVQGALEDIGESVFERDPNGGTSQGGYDVEKIWRQAMRYLDQAGLNRPP